MKYGMGYSNGKALKLSLASVLTLTATAGYMGDASASEMEIEEGNEVVEEVEVNEVEAYEGEFEETAVEEVVEEEQVEEQPQETVEQDIEPVEEQPQETVEQEVVEPVQETVEVEEENQETVQETTEEVETVPEPVETPVMEIEQGTNEVEEPIEEPTIAPYNTGGAGGPGNDGMPSETDDWEDGNQDVGGEDGTEDEDDVEVEFPDGFDQDAIYDENGNMLYSGEEVNSYNNFFLGTVMSNPNSYIFTNGGIYEYNYEVDEDGYAFNEHVGNEVVPALLVSYDIQTYSAENISQLAADIPPSREDNPDGEVDDGDDGEVELPTDPEEGEEEGNDDGNEDETEEPPVDEGDEDESEDEDNTEEPPVDEGDEDESEDEDNTEEPPVDEGDEDESEDEDNTEEPPVDEGDEDESEDEDNTEEPPVDEGDEDESEDDNTEEPPVDEGDEDESEDDNTEEPPVDEGDEDESEDDNTEEPPVDEGDEDESEDDNTEEPPVDEGDEDESEDDNTEEPPVDEGDEDESEDDGSEDESDGGESEDDSETEEPVEEDESDDTGNNDGNDGNTGGDTGDNDGESDGNTGGDTGDNDGESDGNTGGDTGDNDGGTDAPQQNVSHGVVWGNTLYGIAQQHGISWQSLQQYNNIQGTLIFPGQVLLIPGVYEDNNGDGVADEQVVVHIVQSGETLSGIANDYQTTWQKLQQDNNIENADLIFEGQQIEVRDAQSSNGGNQEDAVNEVTVQSGDTLSSIAREHGTTWQKLFNDNDNVTNANIIHPGQTLVVK